MYEEASFTRMHNQFCGVELFTISCSGGQAAFIKDIAFKTPLTGNDERSGR